MKFAIRHGVCIDDYKERLLEVKGVPIELALPYKLDDYLAQAEKGFLDALTIVIRQNGTVVHSVHAPQGHLTDPGFMSWATETVRFAEGVGASVVVFHPEQSAKDRRLDAQTLALQNLKRLRRETETTVAVETFGGPKRILSPEEIGEKGLPMVLDTSHLSSERTMEVIKRYHKTIALVHLSEPRDGKQHMPVVGFGFEVLDALKEVGWEGPVTLEYLPEFHDRLAGDRDALEGLYARQDGNE
jgi:sugar phosphate isomerase/epimerase